MTDEIFDPMQGDTNDWSDNDGLIDPAPEPKPAPGPILEPEPGPFPDPTPHPEPDPVPEPAPDPDPDPDPVPFSQPVPEDKYKTDQDTDDEIEKLLERTKHFQCKVPEKPASIAKKMCPTRHGCTGATDCDSCLGNYPV